jgi:hypothetical protein
VRSTVCLAEAINAYISPIPAAGSMSKESEGTGAAAGETRGVAVAGEADGDGVLVAMGTVAAPQPATAISPTSVSTAPRGDLIQAV